MPKRYLFFKVGSDNYAKERKKKWMKQRNYFLRVLEETLISLK